MTLNELKTEIAEKRLRFHPQISSMIFCTTVLISAQSAFGQLQTALPEIPRLTDSTPNSKAKPVLSDKSVVRTDSTAGSSARILPELKPSSRETLLEARIRELEADAAMKSSKEVELEQRLKSLEESLRAPIASSNSSLNPQVPGAPPADPPAGEEAYISPGVDLEPGSAGSPALSDVAIPATAPAADNKPQMPYTPKLKRGFAGFGPGFVISSDDDEYQLQFHNLTQFEFRQYNFQTMNPTHSTFDFPRQRLIFNGRLTKPIEYFIATNWGINNLALLDCFINLHYDDRVQIKLGRFKTPWAYEFYAEPSNGLINPERSIFFNNYGPNRDVGAMVWGQIFDKTADYAVGVFNGVRSGFVDNNNAKEVIAYFNSRPLEKSGIDMFKHWNMGGSVDYNVYNGPARPDVFRTNIPFPGDPNVSPQWLNLNNNVQSFGTQTLWSAHSAYYYKSLSLIGEYMGGFETYAKSTSLTKGTHVPTAGWYIQSGYFLTGEQVSSRGIVQPLHAFNPKSGDGLGALELTGRWANQSVDKSIFNFASESKWTNDTNVVDVGVNWYWNSYIKFYAGWQRAMYGQPIQAAPGLTPSSPPSYWMSSTDMLWLRAQLFY